MYIPNSCLRPRNGPQARPNTIPVPISCRTQCSSLPRAGGEPRPPVSLWDVERAAHQPITDTRRARADLPPTRQTVSSMPARTAQHGHQYVITGQNMRQECMTCLAVWCTLNFAHEAYLSINDVEVKQLSKAAVREAAILADQQLIFNSLTKSD